MELKQLGEEQKPCLQNSLNRTFMELKQVPVVAAARVALVLIVPLWN